MKRWQKNILVKPKKTKKRLRKKTQNTEIFFWKKNVEKPHLHQRLHHWSKVVTIQWRLGFPSSRSGGSKLAVPDSLVYTDLWAAHTHLAKALALRHLGGHTAGGCATAHDDLRNYWSQKKTLPASTRGFDDMNWSHGFWGIPSDGGTGWLKRCSCWWNFWNPQLKVHCNKMHLLQFADSRGTWM